LGEIYEYSVRNFGLKTARRYLSGLHAVFGVLAENPRIGTDQGWIKRGMWRLFHESHVIYYRPEVAGVLIVDILHEAQDAARHFDK
jgi:toxin ParE1/3/4